jgi:twitching motility protein PilT
MVMTRAIAHLIETEQSHQIPSQLQTGGEYGMQLMDQALLEAVNHKVVDPDDAIRYASDKTLFAKFVTDTTVLKKIDVLTF